MRRAAPAAAALAAACNFFEPRFPAGEGVFRCGPGADSVCPAGHVCAGDRCVPEEGGEAEAEGEVACAEGGTPSIRIAEPGEGDCVPVGPLTVSVVPTDFSFDPDGIDREAVPGCGHWHRFLDGQYLGPSAERTWTIEVAAGCHCLRAELHNNDHTDLAPPVSHQATIRVGDDCDADCGDACRPPPDAGAGDAPARGPDGGLPVSLEGGLPGLDGATGTADAGAPRESDCANGVDDDGDRDVDCDDPDCERDPGCFG